ncbi:hypothetical protein LQF12_12295 [Ruania suaedae]|uniref:hypothetical protein n=1 Tax=Ruania suaedae TaxID=2897774 RepID=UPI001E4DFAAA|nr:hypothetical protein [Ruania suaedae]UFU02281.1 hypothetical protein LQF12_12295 [Ruania suaedae]
MVGGAGSQVLDARTAPAGDSSRAGVAIRIVLLILMALLLSNEVTRPVPSSMARLQDDLDAGRVTAMQIERPTPGDGAIQGRFTVRWDTGLLDFATQYEYRQADAGRATAPDQPDLDEAAGLAERARAAGVEVTEVAPMRGQVDTNGYLAHVFGGWVAVPGLFLAAGLLIALATGPQPRFATRWAWFWLASAIPLLWMVFLLTEPGPLWHGGRRAATGREPAPAGLEQDRRLRGGWAFIMAAIAAAVLANVPLPGFAGWHPLGS